MKPMTTQSTKNKVVFKFPVKKQKKFIGSISTILEDIDRLHENQLYIVKILKLCNKKFDKIEKDIKLLKKTKQI